MKLKNACVVVLIYLPSVFFYINVDDHMVVYIIIYVHGE
jgi:hypothetical protein